MFHDLPKVPEMTPSAPFFNGSALFFSSPAYYSYLPRQVLFPLTLLLVVSSLQSQTTSTPPVSSHQLLADAIFIHQSELTWGQGPRGQYSNRH